MSPPNVDDLISPKVANPRFNCEYCPFDLFCDGVCIMGVPEGDDGPDKYPSVAS